MKDHRVTVWPAGTTYVPFASAQANCGRKEGKGAGEADREQCREALWAGRQASARLSTSGRRLVGLNNLNSRCHQACHIPRAAETTCLVVLKDAEVSRKGLRRRADAHTHRVDAVAACGRSTDGWPRTGRQLDSVVSCAAGPVEAQSKGRPPAARRRAAAAPSLSPKQAAGFRAARAPRWRNDQNIVRPGTVATSWYSVPYWRFALSSENCIPSAAGVLRLPLCTKEGRSAARRKRREISGLRSGCVASPQKPRRVYATRRAAARPARCGFERRGGAARPRVGGARPRPQPAPATSPPCGRRSG